MNLSNPASLVYFRVVTDRIGRPCALLLDTAGPDPSTLHTLFTGPSFVELSAGIACFYRHDLDPTLVSMLQSLGWAELVPGSLLRVDQRLVTSALPPGAALIDGNWCMAPPARAIGAQVASRMRALQLVQLVATDAATHEIEALLRLDPTLSYNLLRLVNSIGMGGGRKVTSFAQALMILGRQQLRRWLNLMLFAARDGDNRASLLLARVVVRACGVERLAKARGLDKFTQEEGFMVGLFSLLGILFGVALPEVLAPLTLDDAVLDALLNKSGELGVLLQLMETAEQSGLDRVDAQLEALQLAPDTFNQAMLETTIWMLGALNLQRGTEHG
jgi:c-di-GMP-related signal transduction protein